MKYVNKRMVLSINRLVMSLTTGYTDNNSNLRVGQSLAFVDKIYVNEIFGMTLYQSIFEKAAAYMFYIIKNHIFIDGNKRTGLAVAITFLEWNNICFSPFDEEKVFDFVISIASGENNPDKSIPRITGWLKEMSLQ